MSRRAVTVVGVVVALAVWWWFASKSLAAPGGMVAVGTPAPDFRGEAIAQPGTFKTIADYKGEVVLVNLWATWCVPCVTEMPSIQRLYDRYKDRGFKVVGIAVDDPPFADRVREFIQQRGFTFEILHEGSGKVEQDYRTRGIPATYLVGRDGRIRMIRQGASDWDAPSARAVVEQLLGTGGSSGGTP